mmetsp:Transcript_16773/g.43323  ORF Transcript_16773/g.43323 Transcript_16773/m.43323 type:complete len:425 (+) Transcript_16773:52-1326(+)
MALRLLVFVGLALSAQATCKQQASLLSWLVSPCDELTMPTSADTGSHLSGPVVVNLGPAVLGHADKNGLDPMLVKELEGTQDLSLDDMDDFHQDMQGLLDALGGHFAEAVRAGGFKTNAEDGHLKLRAVLPGYALQPVEEHGAGGPDVDVPSIEPPPLSVRIVGHSLVVSGHKRDGRMTSSFQRSFVLPRGADAERISVHYSTRDGALEVDVPGRAVSTQVGKAWTLSWEDAGSHTSIVVSSGHVSAVVTPKPALRGTSKKSVAQALLSGLHEIFHLSEAKDLLAQVEQPSAALEGIQEIGKAVQATPEHASELTPPAMVVQRRDARPFWRLGSSGSSGTILEVVAPHGVVLGRPSGSSLPFYSGGATVADSAPQPIGQVELPVNITDRDCTWALEPPPQEQVLECKVDTASVRALRIDVAQEL